MTNVILILPCFLLFCTVERSDILELFRTVFYVLTSAMQDEPANKTFFMDEVLGKFHVSLRSERL